MKFLCTGLLLFANFFLTGQNLNNLIDTFYLNYVTEEGLVKYEDIEKDKLSIIVKNISSQDISSFNTNEHLSFYINSYNIHIINKVMENYPDIQSVNQIKGFFTQPIEVGREQMSLDKLEGKIFELYPNGRLHLVLNCGAMSCPPLLTRAFRGISLDTDINEAVRKALLNDKIINHDKETISKIFLWYKSDFKPDVKTWINDRSSLAIDKLEYMIYNWTLNIANDVRVHNREPSKLKTETRYFASNLYNNGEYEINIFNNYYTQTDDIDTEFRSDWFTSNWSFLYGINKRVNIGFDIRIRSTKTGLEEIIGSFEALHFSGSKIETDTSGNTVSSSRSGLSAIGLKIKYQPIKTIRNLTFRHILYIPTIGYNEAGFLDWESPVLLNDIFFDKEIGDKASYFANLGIHIENINGAILGTDEGYYQISIPFNLIYSYFPNKKSTIYLLGNIVPRYGISVINNGDTTNKSWDPYGQIGIGYKYFVTDQVQLEALYTKFFSNVENRSAATYNIGFRYYGW